MRLRKSVKILKLYRRDISRFLVRGGRVQDAREGNYPRVHSVDDTRILLFDGQQRRATYVQVDEGLADAYGIGYKGVCGDTSNLEVKRAVRIPLTGDACHRVMEVKTNVVSFLYEHKWAGDVKIENGTEHWPCYFSDIDVSSVAKILTRTS